MEERNTKLQRESLSTGVSCERQKTVLVVSGDGGCCCGEVCRGKFPALLNFPWASRTPDQGDRRRGVRPR